LAIAATVAVQLKRSQLCNFFEDVMLIGSRFQIIFTTAATGANAGTDHAVHHIHVAVAPGAELFVNIQQLLSN
jgi:hypothetical protein